MPNLHRTTCQFTVLILFTMTGLAVTGCSENAACPTTPAVSGFAIAVGDRANSPQPSWPSQLDTELDKIIKATEDGIPGKGVTFVRADGIPAISCVRTFDARANNEPARKVNRSKFKQVVRDQTASMTAQKSEADPLTALGLAGAAAGPGGTVVLIDSGLQTLPPLDFGKSGMIDTDIDHIIGQLTKAKALPDLHDRKVVLVGIGYTAPPQTALGEERRAHLIELWQRIAAATGAKPVDTVITPNTDASDADLPRVTVIPVSLIGVQPRCNTRMTFTDSGDVGFLPDSTDFRSEAAAHSVLDGYAKWVCWQPNGNRRSDRIGGALWTDNGNSGLSLARAQRVRDVLVKLGANGAQLKAVGEGWGPFPAKTAPPDPISDPLNRHVVIELKCK